MKRRIEVAAHRGNVENAPENTMPAFTDAYGIDVDMIELDLRMTKDHEIVVIHDATVDLPAVFAAVSLSIYLTFRNLYSEQSSDG